MAETLDTTEAKQSKSSSSDDTSGRSMTSSSWSADEGAKPLILECTRKKSTVTRIVAADQLTLAECWSEKSTRLGNINVPPFDYITVENGKTRHYLWRASKECTGQQVKTLVTAIQTQRQGRRRSSHSKSGTQSIHINTASHGNKEGKTIWHIPHASHLAETNFFLTDLKTILGDDQASIHLVSSYAGPIYPCNANHFIDAWCFSSKLPVPLFVRQPGALLAMV